MIINTMDNSETSTVLPCWHLEMIYSSAILSFQVTEPGAEHTVDYASCSIENGQKTRESARVYKMTGKFTVTPVSKNHQK